MQSKLRNRLGNDKAGKLTFLVRALNQKECWNDADTSAPSSSSNTTHSLDWVSKPLQVENEQATKGTDYSRMASNTGMDRDFQCDNTCTAQEAQIG